MNSVKRYFVLFLAVIMLLSLCACGKEPTAREQLNEKEEILFKYLIEITSDDFFEPASVKILEIGDYTLNSQTVSGESITATYDGSTTVVVRLRGENKVGGTLNHFYCIALSDSETIEYDYFAEKWGFPYNSYAGDYIELGDDYVISKSGDTYNIGNLNRAIAEYWKDMGF